MPKSARLFLIGGCIDSKLNWITWKSEAEMKQGDLYSRRSLVPISQSLIFLPCSHSPSPFTPATQATEKAHRALLSSQAPSNKAISNMVQNGGHLKRICDVFSFFLQFPTPSFKFVFVGIQRWRTFGQSLYLLRKSWRYRLITS